MTTLAKLELKEIVFDYNSREIKEDLSDLMISIDSLGLLEPVGVVKSGKKYKLIYGFRRFHACKKLGHKFINCIIQDYDEEKLEVIANAAENFQRKNLSPFEKGVQIHHLLMNYNFTKKEVMVSLGINEKQFRNYKALHDDLPKQYRDKVQIFSGKRNEDQQTRGLIPFNLASKIISESKAKGLNSEARNKLFDMASKGKLRTEEIPIFANKIKTVGSVEKALEKHDAIIARPIFLLKSSDVDLIKKSGYSIKDYLERIIYGLEKSFKKIEPES